MKTGFPPHSATNVENKDLLLFPVNSDRTLLMWKKCSGDDDDSFMLQFESLETQLHITVITQLTSNYFLGFKVTHK